jgi:hypothetical protein
MSVHFEAPMLLITQCPDRSRWYAKYVGTVVPYRGHDDLSGFLSAEEGGYSNYVLSQDAHVVQAQFGPMDAQRWPYADVPRRAIVTVQRRGVAQAKPVAYHVAGSQATRNATRNAGQSHAHSWTEATVNIAVGFAVSVAITAVVMPAYGHHVTLSENLQITAIFTVASLLRSVALRRAFNHITTREQA